MGTENRSPTPSDMTFDWLARQNDETIIEALFHAGRINYGDRAYWLQLLPRLRSHTPSETAYPTVRWYVVAVDNENELALEVLLRRHGYKFLVKETA
jgi:hypothetical protein